jgi:lipopolysaccharide assembly outer membrane protein LptD (OstA)
MKLAILGIALVACLPLFPQDQPTALPQNFQVFRISGGYRVVAEDGRFVNAIAAAIEAVKPLRVVRLKGDVEITINGVELRADEVDCHWDTGELEPLGNVHLKPVDRPNQ